VAYAVGDHQAPSAILHRLRAVELEIASDLDQLAKLLT
jgi:hypothetical protein